MFREIRQLTLLALPLALAQLGQASMGFVDTLMVGRLGSSALAGIALGNTVFFLVLIVCSGVVMAVNPLVAQAHGSKNHQAVGRAVRQGLWLATVLGLLALLFFRFIGPLLRFLGQDEATVALAAPYVHAIAWGFIPALWLVALRSMLEGLSRPRPIMLITLAGVGLNIVGDYVLMFGKLGFPALGVVGTGWASAFVYWLMFALAALYVYAALRRYRVFAGLRTPDVATLRELVLLGAPMGMMLGFETSMFTATALLMGILGATQLAAHQIAIQCASLTFTLSVGVATATSVRVGHAQGRRDDQAARRSGFVGMGLCAAIMSLTALSFWLFPKAIISLFLAVNDPANQAVVATAVTYLGLAAMFQVFDGLQVSASGALRGLKDTRIPMLITLLAYWLIGMSSGIYLAFGAHLGGRGLWFGLALGLATAGLLLSWRFARHFRRREGALAAPYE